MNDIFPYVLIAFGTVFFAAFSLPLFTFFRFNRFIRTDGTIQSHTIEEHKNMEKITLYCPKITYSYRINKSEFIGSSISNISRSEKQTGYAEKIFLKYPIGSNFKVFVDPKDYQKSYLTKSSIAEITFPLLFGASLVIGGIAWIASS